MLTRSEAEKNLLSKGIASYSNALAALCEFERLLQESCRAAAGARLAEISESLSTRLTFLDVMPNPGRRSNDGQNASVGVRYQDEEGLRHQFYVWWYKGTCNLVASVEFKEKKAAATALGNLRKAATTESVSEEYGEVYLWRRIAPKLDVFDEALESVLQDWANLWKRAGGLSNLARGAGVS